MTLYLNRMTRRFISLAKQFGPEVADSYKGQWRHAPLNQTVNNQGDSQP